MAIYNIMLNITVTIQYEYILYIYKNGKFIIFRFFNESYNCNFILNI